MYRLRRALPEADGEVFPETDYMVQGFPFIHNAYFTRYTHAGESHRSQFVTNEWSLFDPGEGNEDHVWDQVALSVRETAIRRGMSYVLLTLFPDPDLDPPTVAMPRAQTFSMEDFGQITGALLAGWFEQQLHSDGTLKMAGMRITMEPWQLRDAPGAGIRRKQRGTALLPKKWAGKGISVNPNEATDDPEILRRLAVNCGPRALLVALDKYWTECLIDTLLDRAEVVRIAMGCGDHMYRGEFAKFVQLAAFSKYRVAVWELPITKPVIFKGEHWIWPLNQTRLKEDDFTLNILYHNRHYYGVTNDNAFRQMRATHRSNQVWVRCFVCLADIRKTALDTHLCQDYQAIQCSICLEYFLCDEALETHISERNQNYPPCDCCGVTVFNGPQCFITHLDTNCVPLVAAPAAPPPVKERCPTCECNFIAGKPHQCGKRLINCFGCHEPHKTMAELKAHRCQLLPKKCQWLPVREKQVEGQVVSTIWKSHWAYDFETNKCHARRPGLYEHKVLSWGIQLMLPSQRDRDYVAANFILDELEMRLAQAFFVGDQHVFHERVPADDDCPAESIRFFGRCLESFISFVEEVVCRSSDDLEGIGAHDWQPTLWAHNGSKFDAKFIFDYYANGRRYDMAGTKFLRTYGGAPIPTDKRDRDKAIRWTKANYSDERGMQMEITNVGSRLLRIFIKSKMLTFKCSHAHHAMSLRALPSVFALRTPVKKGEFPYTRLSDDAWGSCHARGLPPLLEYAPRLMTCGRRKQTSMWWMEEQAERNVPYAEILAGAEAAGITQLDFRAWYPYPKPFEWKEHDPSRPPTPWLFDAEMWDYLRSDIHVLARAMEAYHAKAEELNDKIRETIPSDDKRMNLVVSPLDCSTAPGWAFAMYTNWFMPKDLIYTLMRKGTHAYVTGALRGGRTDKRGNYLEITDELYALGHRIKYVDVCSLYPSVQDCSVHDTHFPTGHAWWINEIGQTAEGRSWKDLITSAPMHLRNQILIDCIGPNRTGYVTVSTATARYSTHPVLHHLAGGVASDGGPREEPKLLFSNISHSEQTYFWPELLHAMNVGDIVVTSVIDGLFFDKGTTVFESYVKFFFNLKDYAQAVKNKGLRALAKLLLNSLWGKFGQRSYPVKEWVSDNIRLDYLYSQFRCGNLVLLGSQNFSPHRIHLEYRDPVDKNNLATTAPHIAAAVSAWGRIMLHKLMLHPHGQRAVYCDTDSAIIYLRPGDNAKLDPLLGSDIGKLTDELEKIIEDAGHDPAAFPDAYIREVVLVAPKTYALRIISKDPPLEVYKVVCKGFQPSYNNAQAVSFRTFKELVFTQYGLAESIGSKRPLTEEESSFQHRTCIRSSDTLQFVSGLGEVPAERTIDRGMSGHYTKGIANPLDPRLICPLGSERQQDPDTFLSFARPDHHYP